MQTMTSRWETGTYDLLVQLDKEETLVVTMFARAVDLDDEDADEDAPVLAQEEFPRAALGGAAVPDRLVLIGEKGILPEDLEFNFGGRLALSVAIVLSEAALQDSRGLDAADAPWRTPQPSARVMSYRAEAVARGLSHRMFGG